MSCLHEQSNLYHKIYRAQEDIYQLERLLARPEMEDNKEFMKEQLRKKKAELKQLEEKKAFMDELIKKEFAPKEEIQNRKEFAPKEEIPKNTGTYTDRRKEKARKKKLKRMKKIHEFRI